MLAQNEIGDKVRDYYLIIESLWKDDMEDRFKREQEEKEEIKNALIKTTKSLNAISKKRRYHKMKLGSCVYVWHTIGTTRHKIGITDDIKYI